MFIKPAVVPRIQPALRSIRDSINISNIRDIRDNYFIRANNRQAGPHPPPRSNRQQQQGQTQASENNNNYSSNRSSDEESLGPGFSVCGICRVCTCIKLDFVKTPVGIIKVAELVLCLIINNILTKYGEEYSAKLGRGFTMLSLINSSCLFVSLVLVLCYSFSSDTYNRVRASLFEVFFTLICASFYCLSSALLSRTVFIHLFHYYTKIPNFNAYPALTGAYVIGYALAALLAIDGALAYRLMKTTK